MINLFVFLILSNLANAQVVSQSSSSDKLERKSGGLYKFPEEISESSGIAVSRINPNVYWTHNDSGDGPVLYAVEPSIGIVSRIYLLDVEAYDWEDMAISHCPDSDKYCLYVADIGDNLSIRDSVQVHIVEEPIIDLELPVRLYVTPLTMNMKYPDSVSRNAEGFAVTDSLDFLIIPKLKNVLSTPVFKLSFLDWSNNLESEETFVLKPYGRLDLETDSRFQVITSADFYDRVLVVKTYTDVHFFESF